MNDGSLNQENGALPQRIEYIDALRGFVIFCVLMHHVSYFVLGTGSFSFKTIWDQFQLPIFFFISGFVVYKADVRWTWQGALHFVGNKASRFLLGTAVFCAAYAYYSNWGWYQVVTDQFKGGYWFTYILVIFYSWYAFLALIPTKYQSWMLFLLSILIYMAGGPKGILSLPVSEDLKGVLSMVQWRLFCYFLWGVLARKHFRAFQSCLNNQWILTFAITLFFLINLFADFHPENKILSRLYYFVRDTAASYTVFSFFYLNQKWFTRAMFVGRSLQTIGKRTLDIYFIHYFLIPFGLKESLNALLHPIDPIIELLISIFLGILLLLGSLAIGQILRMSPLLARGLFGTQTKF